MFNLPRNYERALIVFETLFEREKMKNPRGRWAVCQIFPYNSIFTVVCKAEKNNSIKDMIIEYILPPIQKRKRNILEKLLRKEKPDGDCPVEAAQNYRLKKLKDAEIEHTLYYSNQLLHSVVKMDEPSMQRRMEITKTNYYWEYSGTLTAPLNQVFKIKGFTDIYNSIYQINNRNFHASNL
jgi:hypothetical protein